MLCMTYMILPELARFRTAAFYSNTKIPRSVGHVFLIKNSPIFLHFPERKFPEFLGKKTPMSLCFFAKCPGNFERLVCLKFRELLDKKTPRAPTRTRKTKRHLPARDHGFPSERVSRCLLCDFSSLRFM